MHNHAVKANGFIFSLRGFANTAPRDQVHAPDRVNKTPKNLPSRLGAPVKIKTPKKETQIPSIFFIHGLSLSKKKAMIIPKGTSACTNNTADEASIIFKPE